MRRRPVCILCMLLVVFLCVTDWLGFFLIRGNPLPQSVQPDMDQKASGIHHLRGGGQVPGE